MDDKTRYQAEIFGHRLSKNYNQLKKWARKNGITCYRLYDRDIPEVPLAVDLYRLMPEELFTKFQAERLLNKERDAVSANGPNAAEVVKAGLEKSYLHIYLYQRPYEKDEAEEEKWLSAMADCASETLQIERDHVIIKTRKKLSGNESGRTEQYEKINSGKHITGTIFEQGQLFNVNLTDYLDTGIFLDHRLLRKIVREKSAGKSVLNLFCYTGSFSVYAAEGKARRIESVDMSKTYLAWAQENLSLNDFNPLDSHKYIFERQDVVSYLKQKKADVDNGKEKKRYDIIILDPPTFSNSKRTETTLDINRDWPELVSDCLTLLSEEGTLYFSTNSRRLSFEADLLPKDENGSSRYSAREITAKTISQDYRNQKIHRVWEICKAKAE